MNRNDAGRFDYSDIDAGDLLPGCSIPVVGDDGPLGDGQPLHAFRRFQPLAMDGHGPAALRQIADSMTDVIRSLDRLHGLERCYGRITSGSLHNRGTERAPAATLWIDPQRAAQSDAVHGGDSEAMYWTAPRLKSAANAHPADDWYALGIVLAELALSSSAVRKIWELSRQDGQFAESLIKNLNVSGSAKRLAKMATALIRDGAAGKVNPATIQRLSARRPVYPAGLMYCLLAIMTVSVLMNVIGASLQSGQRKQQQQLLAAMEKDVDRLTQEVETMHLKQAESKLVATAVPQPAADVNPSGGDQRRWTEQLAGRSLEQVIAQAGDFRSSQWARSLETLATVNGQQSWRAADPTLRRLIQLAVDAPWESRRIEQATQRLDALGEAYQRWQSWARSKRGIGELQTQQSLLPSGQVKDLLGQWLGEALEVRQFDLRVIDVRPAADNSFTAHRVGFDTPRGSASLDWQWETSEGKAASIELPVEDYHAGDPLSFWLQQDSSIPLWNTTVIAHTLESPLLVWQLGRELRLEDSESGYSVILTTNKRFGPPVSIGDRALGSGAKTAPPSATKKVVDPMDSLPF
ncbi:hypothetical protein NHH03_00365 [Stieleria sp. TO1_6]|uniref:hypothetical protein n=1 Tax=Stieleria tagensis TaxID=2956795 RepID=UPI00209AC736|nr:hypothetical protein [Stieleria tagensis]MCO8120173.1 hypothetical protein [Stieleria tagensis]